MSKKYPVKLIAYTKDPFARIKAAQLDSPGDIELYDSRLYSLYLVEGGSVSRKDNGMSKLHPNSKEYKEIMREAANL